MYIFVSAFIISIASTVGMVGFRMWELKTGRVEFKNGVSNSHKRHSVVLKHANILGVHISKVRERHITPLIYSIERSVINKIIDILKRAQRKFTDIKHSIEGKGVVGGNGRASAFIKSISDHKKKNGGSLGKM